MKRALVCLDTDENNMPITGMKEHERCSAIEGIVASSCECKQVAERSTTVVRDSTLNSKLKVLRLRAFARGSWRRITLQTPIHPAVILETECEVMIRACKTPKT